MRLSICYNITYVPEVTTALKLTCLRLLHYVNHLIQDFKYPNYLLLLSAVLAPLKFAVHEFTREY